MLQRWFYSRFESFECFELSCRWRRDHSVHDVLENNLYAVYLGNSSRPFARFQASWSNQSASLFKCIIMQKIWVEFSAWKTHDWQINKLLFSLQYGRKLNEIVTRWLTWQFTVTWCVCVTMRQSGLLKTQSCDVIVCPKACLSFYYTLKSVIFLHQKSRYFKCVVYSSILIKKNV